MLPPKVCYFSFVLFLKTLLECGNQVTGVNANLPSMETSSMPELTTSKGGLQNTTTQEQFHTKPQSTAVGSGGASTPLNNTTTPSVLRDPTTTQAWETQSKDQPDNPKGGLPRPCTLKCKYKPQYRGNSFLQTANKTEIAQHPVICDVNGTVREEDAYATCDLNINSLLEQVPKSRIRQFVFVIACHIPARVRIVRSPNVPKREDVLTYFDIRRCVVDWNDVISVGKAVDLRVLYLFWPHRIIDEIPSSDIIPGVYHTRSLVKGTRFRRRADSTPMMISGMQNLGTVVMMSPPPCSRPDATLLCALPRHLRPANVTFPKIFTDFLWPKMAEATFADLDLRDNHVGAFVETMPNLQWFEVLRNRNQFLSLPEFPWCEHRMLLPRGISRTLSGNSHYARGMDIPPNTYLRSFKLIDSPVHASGLRLRGQIDSIALTKSLVNDGTSNMDILRGVVGLQTADLSHNELLEISPNFFEHSLISLLEINLDFNNLTRIEFYNFQHMIKLKKLSMTHNLINFVHERAFLQTTNLRWVELSFNNIPKLRKHTFFHLTKLETLLVDHNRINTVEKKALPGQNANKVSVLDLSYNDLETVHPEMILFRFATQINLSHNRITTEQAGLLLTESPQENIVFILNHSSSDTDKFQKIMPLNGYRKEVSLAHNNIENINLEKANETRIANFLVLLSFFNFDLTGNPLNCDCHAYALHRFLVKYRAVSKAGVKSWLDFAKKKWLCEKPAALSKRPIEEVGGDRFLCKYNGTCPSTCNCFKRMTDNVTVVDCNDRNLKTLPSDMPEGLLELHFERNQITEIPPREYLAYVTALFVAENDIEELNDDVVELLGTRAKKIYLQDNKIKRLSRRVVDLWSHVKEVNLLHNLFVCDCKSSWLPEWIRQAKHQLVAYYELVCASGRPTGSEIISVPKSEFVCEDQSPVIMAAVFGGILVLIAIIAVVVIRHWRRIKVWLYAKYDWHPFDKMDDSDPKRIFDAYVCYSSHDYSWVVHVLRKRLEYEITPPYHLCLHHRNFSAGEAVMENILQSVRLSKRMIMLVTQNYIDSEWCMLEFRTAHHEVLANNTRNYIIAILDDEVNIESVPEDLQVFLKNTTYLKRSEVHFWDKLFYSLPQKGPRQVVPPEKRRRDSLEVPVAFEFGDKTPGESSGHGDACVELSVVMLEKYGLLASSGLVNDPDVLGKMKLDDLGIINVPFQGLDITVSENAFV